MHYLQIENGCRQLYLRRDLSIDVIELFSGAYPIYELTDAHNSISQVDIKTFAISKSETAKILLISSTNGDLLFQRIDELKQPNNENGHGIKIITDEDCWLKITAAEMLAKCIDYQAQGSF